MAKKAERKTLAQEGVSLAQLAAATPAAPSRAEQSAAARAKKIEENKKSLTPEVIGAIKTLRAKGYGWALIANTVNDSLKKKISVTLIREVVETAVTKSPVVPVKQAAPAASQKT